MNTDRSAADTSIVSATPVADPMVVPATLAADAEPGATPVALSPLPDDVALLQQMIRELLQTLAQTQHERDGLQQRLHLLLRKLYGPKAERYDPNQPLLFPELAATTPSTAAPPESAVTEKVSSKSRRQPQGPGHGRNPLPEDLPRRRAVQEVPAAQRLCPCCGDVQEPFGEDVSEQLDFVPSSLYVKQTVRLKYTCPKCHEGVTVAPKPAQPIDKGLPGSGLLAQIAVSKYADHLPLYRLERIFNRQGVELSRATMAGWMRELADRFRVVAQAMMTEVLAGRMLHTDATKMPFQDPLTKGRTRSGQMWVYVGDAAHPFDVFDFCDDHSGKRIRAVLENYRGYLNADAHNVYDALFRKPGQPILEVGCWAHARRYFFDARENDPVRAHEALAQIRRLYAIETQARASVAERKLSGAEAEAVFLVLRQQESLPIVTALGHWLEEQRPLVAPKSLIGQAIQYALNHWEALTRFLTKGFLAIDNNVAENALRTIALGRKNWLFAGSEEGARTAATLFTLTSSCRRHGVDAFAYLRDLIDHLTLDPTPSPELLRSLLPDRWRGPPTETSPASSSP